MPITKDEYNAIVALETDFNLRVDQLAQDLLDLEAERDLLKSEWMDIEERYNAALAASDTSQTRDDEYEDDDDAEERNRTIPDGKKAQKDWLLAAKQYDALLTEVNKAKKLKAELEQYMEDKFAGLKDTYNIGRSACADFGAFLAQSASAQELDQAAIKQKIEGMVSKLTVIQASTEAIGEIKLEKATHGYIEPSKNSSIKTCLLHGVTDLESEAKKAIGSITAKEPAGVLASEYAINSERVVYKNVRLKPGDIIQTVGSLEGNGYLYSEKDHTGKVTSRSHPGTADGGGATQEQIFENKKTIAREQAIAMLNDYDKKKGAIIIASTSNKELSEMTHAYLLLLGRKTHSYIKIRNDVYQAAAPDPVRLYGNTDQAFIDKILTAKGVNPEQLKDEQENFVAVFKGRQAHKDAARSEPKEGVDIPTNTFKP